MMVLDDQSYWLRVRFSMFQKHFCMLLLILSQWSCQVQRASDLPSRVLATSSAWQANPLVTVYSQDPGRCPPPEPEFADISVSKNADLISAGDVREFVTVRDKSQSEATTFRYQELQKRGQTSVVALALPRSFVHEKDCHISYYVPTWKDYQQCSMKYGAAACAREHGVFEIVPVQSSNGQFVFLEYLAEGLSSSAVYNHMLSPPAFVGSFANFGPEGSDEMHEVYSGKWQQETESCERFVLAARGPLFSDGTNEKNYRGVLEGHRLCNIEMRLQSQSPVQRPSYMLTAREDYQITSLVLRKKVGDDYVTMDTPQGMGADGRSFRFELQDLGEFQVMTSGINQHGQRQSKTYVYEISGPGFNGVPTYIMSGVTSEP
jgi:hypothetical protein